MCKLTDFTSKELDTILTAVVKYEADLTYKIEISSEYEIKMDLGYEKELNNIQLWRTQLIQAKVEVIMRERIAHN